MKNKIWSAFVALILVGSLLLAACAQPAPTPTPTPKPTPTPTPTPVKPITLRWADHSPPAGLRFDGIDFMRKKIEERTGGRIKFDFYWGASLLKAKEMLVGVQENICDIAYVNPNYYPKQMALWGAWTTFFIGPEDQHITNDIWHKAIGEIPDFEADLAKWNQMLVTYAGGTPYALISTTSVKGLDGFKGLKIRAPGRWDLVRLEAGGATPVSMPMTEAYMALDKGTIDGVLCNLEAQYRFKFHEPAKYVLTMKPVWSPMPFLYTINLDVWNKLPPDIQEIILDAGIEQAEYMSELTNEQWDEIIAKEREAGVTVIPMPAADLQRWSTTPGVEEIPSIWAQEVKELGIDGEPILKHIDELLAEALAK